MGFHVLSSLLMVITMVEGSTEISGSGIVAKLTLTANSSGISLIGSSIVTTSTQSMAGEEEEKVKFHIRGTKSVFSVRKEHDRKEGVSVVI